MSLNIYTVCGVGFEFSTVEPPISIQKKFILNHHDTIVSNIRRFSEVDNFEWLEDELLMEVPDTTPFAEHFQCLLDDFEYSFWELFCFVVSHETHLNIEYYKDDFGKSFILQPYDDDDLREEYERHNYPLLTNDKDEKADVLNLEVFVYFNEVNFQVSDADIRFIHNIDKNYEF